MVRFRFVQPVGTNELPMGLTIPKAAIRAIKVSPYEGDGDFARVFVSYMDGDTKEVAEGVMYVRDIERVESFVKDRLPTPLEVEQQERESTREHIKAHEAMDALRDSMPYPGKEAKPPEEIDELLRAERELQVDQQQRRREATDFLTWLHATGFRVVNTNLPAKPEIAFQVAIESLANSYAKQVSA